MAPWVGVARGNGGGGPKLLRELGVGGVNGNWGARMGMKKRKSGVMIFLAGSVQTTVVPVGGNGPGKIVNRAGSWNYYWLIRNM